MEGRDTTSCRNRQYKSVLHSRIFPLKGNGSQGFFSLKKLCPQEKSLGFSATQSSPLTSRSVDLKKRRVELKNQQNDNKWLSRLEIWAKIEEIEKMQWTSRLVDLFALKHTNLHSASKTQTVSQMGIHGHISSSSKHPEKFILKIHQTILSLDLSDQMHSGILLC